LTGKTGKTGNREQGTGNRERGTGNREQGAGNREQGRTGNDKGKSKSPAGMTNKKTRVNTEILATPDGRVNLRDGGGGIEEGRCGEAGGGYG